MVYIEIDLEKMSKEKENLLWDFLTEQNLGKYTELKNIVNKPMYLLIKDKYKNCRHCGHKIEIDMTGHCANCGVVFSEEIIQ